MKKFKHYKGTVYAMISVAEHTETGEKLVIYQNDNEETFARPYDMFFGEVEVDGVKIKRFTEIV
ncbi:DUF1653 domain-containing protein [Cytobacillus horneckiae]|uniref:DUF1653 domain-containing protein n=1 Tax=Cytobacillus horneckiae TaxID=549687 RepID=UPI003D9A2A9D